MKVLIIPYCFYTHYNAYSLISQELNSRNINVKYFYISGLPFFDQLNKEYLKIINKKNLINVNTYTLSDKTNYLIRLNNFLKYLLNFYIIKRKLLVENPDLIIIGSDTGGVYIRWVQEICQKKKITIFILQTVLFKPVEGRSNLATYFPKFVNILLKLLKIHRTFNYSGEIPGMYIKNSYVFVLGNTSKRIIQSFGKESKRIFTTGNPEFDFIKKNNTECCEDKINYLKSLGIPEKAKFIIYFTETIQTVYGDGYLEELNKKLKLIFDRLTENFYVIIKFHPRETSFDKIKIRTNFQSRKYIFLDFADNNKLISNSELCISHYSTILFNSILLGKPIISINLIDPEIFIKFPKQVTIDKIEEFEGKMYKTLFDKEYRKHINELLQLFIIDNFSNAYEGTCTKNIVDTIVQVVRY